MMSPKLAEYYTTNYTKCNVSDNFLSSWRGLTYPCHVFQAIGLPLQLLTFWLIVKKTPESMKSIKVPLLISHFWCTLLDTQFCSLSTPFIFFPSFAFFTVGALNWTGIPMIVQMGMVVFTLISTCMSLIYLFESRSICIPENRYKFTKKSYRILYYLIIYSFTTPIFLLMLTIPTNQEDALLDSLKLIPCPSNEFFTENLYVISSNPFLIKFTLIVGIPTLGSFMFFNIFFHVACCIYYLYMAPSKSTSARTRKIQQSFFVGILIQTGVPIVILAAPYVVLVTAMLLDILTQWLTNLVMITLGVHGILESICIIMVHRSYRESVLKMMGKKRGSKNSEFRGETASWGWYHDGWNLLKC